MIDGRNYKGQPTYMLQTSKDDRGVYLENIQSLFKFVNSKELGAVRSDEKGGGVPSNHLAKSWTFECRICIEH